MQTKLKLSEIIKTDCYIDCGSNEKLREVVKVINSLGRLAAPTQRILGIHNTNTFVKLSDYYYWTLTNISEYETIHHILEIDLNN